MDDDGCRFAAIFKGSRFTSNALSEVSILAVIMGQIQKKVSSTYQEKNLGMA